MKALVYTNPKQLNYQDEPMPTIKEDEELVRIDAVGICGSDMHAYLGHDERRVAPLILGHEAAGIVEEGSMKGQQVIINPLVTCGSCSACISGRSNICKKREIISMAPRQGAFAQYVSMPTKNLIPVPDNMDISKAALAEPIATGWHAVIVALKALQKPIPQCKALVIGGGAVGLATALSLNAKGCKDIFLSETNQSRRDTVDKENICKSFSPIDNDIVDDSSIDIVIDCVGSKITRAFASQKVTPGGVFAHVGLSDNLDGLDIRKFTLQEIVFCGVYTYTYEDFKDAVDAMSNGALGELSWYEERPLSQGNNAFKDLLEGKVSSAKIILRP